VHRFSLHKLRDKCRPGFDPAEYSRFKFGDYGIAEKFGIELAQAFVTNVLALQPPSRQLVVLSSPYSFIPTASFALKNHFVFTLNRWLASKELRVCQECKVHRSATYKEDYGNLDAAQRLELINKDSFYVDQDYLEDKTLLFLDDIRITGSHENMIVKMAREYNLNNEVYLIYFAELVNAEIPPSFENYLNYYQVKTIFDLNPIIDSAGFFINTRIVKYILNAVEKDLSAFIPQQNPAFIGLLYDMAIGNGYHTMPAYAANLNLIKTTITHGN